MATKTETEVIPAPTYEERLEQAELQLEYVVSVCRKVEAFVDALAPLKNMLGGMDTASPFSGGLPLNPMALLGMMNNGNEDS